MNIQETLRFLPYALKLNYVPCLIGNTGIGKTEVVEQYCRDNDLDIIITHLAELETTDFIGLYQIKNNKTTNCIPDFLPDGSTKRGGIIFLDEINRCKPDMRQAMYEFLQKKKIHTYKIPSNWKIVAAANPFDGEYETYEFDDALMARLCWIPFSPTPSECQKFINNAFNNDLSEFISSTDGVLDFGAPVKVDIKFPPRSGYEAAKLYDIMKHEDTAFTLKCLATVMPPEKLGAFSKYLNDRRQISFEDVLNKKKTRYLNELIDQKRQDVLNMLTDQAIEMFNKREFSKQETKVAAEFFSKCPTLENFQKFILGLDLTKLTEEVDGEKIIKKDCCLRLPEINELRERLKRVRAEGTPTDAKEGA